MAEKSPIQSLGLSQDWEKLAWEARARITWGDPPDDVVGWLMASGVNRATAQRIVDACTGERAASLRIKGIRDLVVGGVLLLVAAGIFVGYMKILHSGAGRARVVALGPVIPLLLGGYAIHLLVRGGERVLRGARTSGADSDVGQWDM